MNEYPFSDEFIEEVLKDATELNEKDAKSIIKKLPSLFMANDIIIEKTSKDVRIMVAAHVGEQESSKIYALLGLALLYTTACESNAMEIFQNAILKEKQVQIDLLLDILRGGEVFPNLYYRFSRTDGFLSAPVIARKLVLETNENKLSIPFYELKLQISESEDSVKSVKIELDSYEIQALVTDLKKLLKE